MHNAKVFKTDKNPSWKALLNCVIFKVLCFSFLSNKHKNLAACCKRELFKNPSTEIQNVFFA